MPELPDILAYQHALESRLVGQVVNRVVVRSPFVVRTYRPNIDELQGKNIRTIQRLGKRLVFACDSEIYLVLHLMIAGRLKWVDDPCRKPSRKTDLAVFQFDRGTLLITEAGTKKRASIHMAQGKDALKDHDRGGLDVLNCNSDEFAAALTRENHTVKRTLTSPAVFDGIGNAYSDEILCAAQLSPLKWTKRLTEDEIDRLHHACKDTLTHWIKTLIEEFDGRFPDKRGDITAFRRDFCVHGKFGQPCLVCGSPVQRIVYAETETNYCATCQTKGKVLADRSLSRLLKDDWPRTIEEWE